MKLTTVLLVLFTVYAVNGETRYVKVGSSNPVAPYTSWATASDSIGKCIAAASEGDTILLSEGVFSETFDLKRKMVLQGTNKYQTIISAGTLPRPTPQRYWIISLSDSNTIRDLTIIGNSNLTSGASVLYAYPVYLRYTVVENVIFNKLQSGLSLCEGIIRNCTGSIDRLAFIDNPPYPSTVLIEENNFFGQTLLATNQRPFQTAGVSHITVRKNTVAFINTQAMSIIDDALGPPNQTIDFYNNRFIVQGRLWNPSSFKRKCNFVNNSFHVFLYYSDDNQGPTFVLNSQVTFRNNTFSNMEILFSSAGLPPAEFKYNIVWGARRESYMDTTNSFDYPMFMNITHGYLNGWPLNPEAEHPCNLKFQKYSTAIDKGDPAIRDLDRSISDPGAFGGPWGESYTYKDTAPMAPISGTLVYDDSLRVYKANWHRAHDQDMDRYEFHLDTTDVYINHQYIYEGATKDTFTVIPISQRFPGWLFFWMRTVDTAGNASKWVIKGFILLTGVKGEDPMPSPVNHEIAGIYPNPFNAEAKVEYILGTKGRAVFRVYDINGSLLRSIEQGEQDEGRYSMTLSLPQYASGVYFVQLEVKEVSTGKRTLTQSKKIVMVK